MGGAMIYIGCFLHTTNQQEAREADRRHGEFSLIVEAENRDHAMILFKDRLLHFRDASNLFEGEARIYLVRLLELAALSNTTPHLFNYKSVAGDPVMPYIGCTNPSEESEGCRIFDWHLNVPEIDGKGGRPFLAFQAE